MTPEEEKRENLIIYQLSQQEAFKLWRDKYVKRRIALMETQLEQADKLSEVEIRAILKSLLWMRESFIWAFEEIKAVVEISDDKFAAQEGQP